VASRAPRRVADSREASETRGDGDLPRAPSRPLSTIGCRWMSPLHRGVDPPVCSRGNGRCSCWRLRWASTAAASPTARGCSGVPGKRVGVEYVLRAAGCSTRQARLGHGQEPGRTHATAKRGRTRSCVDWEQAARVLRHGPHDDFGRPGP
jgi:hypothetical protein